jgi:glycosyltransferase involved in cell wall biosynthesis
MLIERITSGCAHRVIAVSQSLAHAYQSLRLTSPAKIEVMGARGSVNGLNASRFRRTQERTDAARNLREAWQLTDDTPVIGFVGRFVRDKGISDLIDAFDVVLEELPNARLLLVGDFESGDPVPQHTQERIGNDTRIITTGFVEDSSPYFFVMDVLAFPTYREGFPYVPLEAAAAEVPVVGYRATGVVDAVADGTTGTLVPICDYKALATALIRYLKDPALRKKHGAAAKEIVERDFQPELIWQSMDQLYRKLLANAGRPFEVSSNPCAAAKDVAEL